MTYFLAYEERRNSGRVTAALDRLDMEQVVEENTRRFTDPPPPYASSEETTQPPSPAHTTRELDDVGRVRMRVQTRFKGTPESIFELQARREMERLPYQRFACLSGRKQTLPFDKKLDLKANAENNVRSRWVEQGIWKDKWGPPWPQGSYPMDNTWLWNQPDHLSRPQPEGRWEHEQITESTQRKQKTPTPDFVGNARLFGSPTEQERLNESTSLPVVASVCDPEASRPYTQFFFQVSKERQWVEDELYWKSRDGIGGFDLDAMAYENVKIMWEKDGLWNTEWNLVPGRTWAHEEPDEALETDPCYRRLYHSSSGQDANAFDGPDANTSNHVRSEPEVLNAARQRCATERGFEPQNQPLYSGPSSLSSCRDPLAEASRSKPTYVGFHEVKSVPQGKLHQDQSTRNTDVLDGSTSLGLPAAHSKKRKRDLGLSDGPGEGNNPKHLKRVAGEISIRHHDLRSHKDRSSRTPRDKTPSHLTDSSLQTTSTTVRRSQRLQNKARLKHQGNTSSGSRDAQQVSQPSHDLRSNRFRTSRNAEIVEEGAGMPSTILFSRLERTNLFTASRSRLDRRTVSRSQRKK